MKSHLIDDEPYYAGGPMSSLDRNILLEAGTCWLQNEHKIPTT